MGNRYLVIGLVIVVVSGITLFFIGNAIGQSKPAEIKYVEQVRYEESQICKDTMFNVDIYLSAIRINERKLAIGSEIIGVMTDYIDGKMNMDTLITRIEDSTEEMNSLNEQIDSIYSQLR